VIRIEPVEPNDATGYYGDGGDPAEVNDEGRDEQVSFGNWRQVSDVRRLQLLRAS
jgi:hypothetical protein